MARTMFVTSAHNKLDGRFYVVGLASNFDITWQEPLPNRAHAPVAKPGSDTFAIVARRPDRFVEIRRSRNGEKIHHINAIRGRHFYGHGAFDQTGRYLFLTENDFDRGRGVVGIYDAQDHYKRIDEIPSGGIGPHDIALMPGGSALAVANGGIRTHPDRGRDKLNLDSMIPSLQMIDIATGQLGRRFLFNNQSLNSLSTRHMAVMDDDRDDGRIVVGCQDQAAPSISRSLVYTTEADSETLLPLQVPDAVLEKMSGYVGSIAISADGQLIAASCPRGNLVVFWNADTLAFQGSITSNDVCGLAGHADADAIIYTTGTGNITMLGEGARPENSIRHSFLQWDNHITLT